MSFIKNIAFYLQKHTNHKQMICLLFSPSEVNFLSDFLYPGEMVF